jgi:uncharacterized membrane protein YebE (DUF533 family)
MSLTPPNAELPPDAVRALIQAMYEVAASDGEHPRERALIEEFAAGVDLDGGPASLDGVDTLERAELFLQSLALLALADGRVSELERSAICNYARKLGYGEPEAERCLHDVAVGMLSKLRGVVQHQEAAFEIGARLGLDKFSIAHALAGEQ